MTFVSERGLRAVLVVLVTLLGAGSQSRAATTGTTVLKNARIIDGRPDRVIGHTRNIDEVMLHGTCSIGAPWSSVPPEVALSRVPRGSKSSSEISAMGAALRVVPLLTSEHRFPTPWVMHECEGWHLSP